jgi:hypothetical protein
MTAAIQRFIKTRVKEHGDTALANALGTVDFMVSDGRWMLKAKADEVVMPMIVYDPKTAALRVDALGILRELKASFETIKERANDPNYCNNILAKLDVTIDYMVGAIEADKVLAAAGQPEQGEVLDDQPVTSEGDIPTRRVKATPVLRKRRVTSSQLTAKRLKHALIKASLAGPVSKKAKATKPSYAEVTDEETARAIQAAKTASRLDALTGVVTELANSAINNGEEQNHLRKEQGELREHIQDMKDSTEYLHSKVDETRSDHKRIIDSLEELKYNYDSVNDMLQEIMYNINQGQTDMAGPDSEMEPEGVIPPTATHAHLGIAKPLFPKYTAATDIDIYFDSVERYFRLCGTDERHHIDYTLLAIPQFSTWWQAHVTAHPLDAHSWDSFKTTIKQFLMKEDPHTAAMGKLLRLKQNEMSVSEYCTRFMQLVRDANCQPTDQWLPVHLLQNMNDTSLIRAASSNNGQKWHTITDLVQHLNAITALRPSFTTHNNADHKQRGRGAGRGGYGRGNGSGYQGRGGYNSGYQARGDGGFGRGRGRGNYRARGSGGRGIPQHRGDRAPGNDRPQAQGDTQARFNAATTSADQQRRASSPARDQNKATIEQLKRTLAMLSGNNK